ncbi:MAG: 4Fe-4S double cluster binding domain-containing protein [Thermoleophilia bacterium]
MIAKPPPWGDILSAVAAQGWRARVVAAERLGEARARVAAVLSSGELPRAAAGHLGLATAFSLPAELPAPRSVVVGALARPLTLATLTVEGRPRRVPIPPHYAGYATVPDALAAVVDAALSPHGHRALRADPPLKTLATGSGLARYGRNNIAYVPGLGSYLQLAACVSNAPPPEGATWQAAQELERCARCSACLRACPTGAIVGRRFPLRTDRCLTFVNEDPAPFPAWVKPAWHTCAVGCLRCQQACPENAGVELAVAPPEAFDAAETTAILAAAERESLSAATRAKLERCGLDYSAGLIARNVTALLGG